MRLIIFDLEMLQPGNEIFEIGAVVADLNRLKLETHTAFQQYANPGIPVTDYPLRDGQTIGELTGVTQEILDNSLPLAQVLEDFWHWVAQQGTGNKLVTWGAGDMPHLSIQSSWLGVPQPRRPRLLDLKMIAMLFRHAKAGAKAQGGLEATMQLFGIDWEGGPAHRALNDAINTGRLLLCYHKMIRDIIKIRSL